MAASVLIFAGALVLAARPAQAHRSAKSGGPKANGRSATLKVGRNFFLGTADTPGGAPQ
ncbi:MAG: hypothetical protein HYY76_14055 [Acidobacteria bacterium]|nr:hypothetical protein [Acidobacteriota bacterium]